MAVDFVAIHARVLEEFVRRFGAAPRLFAT